MITDINEKRAEKEGIVTVKGLAKSLLNECEAGDVESFVFVAKDHDGVIRAGWSNTSGTEVMGLLDIGKHYVLDSMRE